jgi:hypothetical protein
VVGADWTEVVGLPDGGAVTVGLVPSETTPLRVMFPGVTKVCAAAGRVAAIENSTA